MIKVLIGNLFESKAQTWINTVNCVGVMGKGVALEFKNRFLDMYEDYVSRCMRGEVKLGRPYLFKRLVPPWILNFPTKDHWRSVANLKNIIEGLEYLLKHYKEWGIQSLAVPPLGCGQGQLEWRIVGPTLYRLLCKMDIPIELYAPYGTPHEELRPEFLGERELSVEMDKKSCGPEWIKPAWVALVEILKRIEEQPYHWPVGRTRFQKIAYFASEQGLPLGIDYQKGSYGPFSPALKALVTRLINNGLIREQRMGKMFGIKVGQTYQDAHKAYATYLKEWEPIIEKTADLFMRMDTNQAEIAATVLYAARSICDSRPRPLTEKDVLACVMQWKQRRKPALDQGEVGLTIRNLAALNWLNVKASNDLPLPSEETVDV
jgi:uncharacterized protein YwgA/O-acetyl-ADP-ribose deacetylase (regulator of RNase III)